MVTVEAQAFGPEALVGMKVVEYIPPTPQGQPTTQQMAAPQQALGAQQQPSQEPVAQAQTRPALHPMPPPQMQQQRSHTQQQSHQQQQREFQGLNKICLIMAFLWFFFFTS